MIELSRAQRDSGVVVGESVVEDARSDRAVTRPETAGL